MTPDKRRDNLANPRPAGSDGYGFIAAGGLLILAAQTLILAIMDWQRLSVETFLFCALNGLLLTAIVLPFLYRWRVSPIVARMDKTRKSLVAALEEKSALSSLLALARSELEAGKRILDQHALVSETDIEGRITAANAELCRISGYTTEELIGKTHRILSSDQHTPQFWQDMQAAIASGAVWRAEVCNKAKDGTLYWVKTTISAIKNADGNVTGYLSVGSDVTQTVRRELALKRAQAQLFEAAAKAKAESAAKSAFLSSVRARMRTPLNGIVSALELLRRTGLSREQSGLLDIAAHSGSTLVGCVNDVRAEAKIETANHEHAPHEESGQTIREPERHALVESRSGEIAAAGTPEALSRILDEHFDELKRRLDESLAAMWTRSLADFKRVTHALAGADRHAQAWHSPRRVELSRTIFAQDEREPALLAASAQDTERTRMRLSERLIEVERVLEPFGRVEPFDAR